MREKIRAFFRKLVAIYNSASASKQRSIIFTFASIGAYLLLLIAVALMELWVVFIPMSIILILVPVLAVLAYLGAPYNVLWFTTVLEGTMKIVVANGKFVTVIPNVKGVFYNEKTRKIEPATGRNKGRDQAGWFTELTGLYHVSWIWPIRRVYIFSIRKVRLIEGRDKIKNIKDKIDVPQEMEDVDHLRWKLDRPFLWTDVDIKGKTRVHFLGKGIFTVWDVYQMLFALGGHFYDNADTIVEGYGISKYKTVDYDGLLTRDTELNPDDLNGPDTDAERQELEEHGMVLYKNYDLKHIVGMICESLVVEEFEISEKDQKIQEAVQQQLVKTELGKAKVIESEFNKTARLLDGDADGGYQERLRSGIARGDGEAAKAFVANGLTPDGVAKIIQMREIKELKGVYAEGGANTMLALPASPAPPEPVSPAPLPEMVTAPATTGPRPQPQQPAPQTSPSLGASFGGGKKKRRWDKQPPTE